MRTPYAISAPLLAAALLVSGCSSSTDDGGAPATKAKAGKEVLFGASCKEAAASSWQIGRGSKSGPRFVYEQSVSSPDKYGIKEPSALELGPSGGTITEIPEDKIDILQTSWEKLFEKADPSKRESDSTYSRWVVGFYGDPDTKPDGRLAEGTYLCAYSDWTTRGDGPDVNAS
ncbi:hypothetical protein [Tsukamurella spumae]|uniref:DUF3558 domain-containing protein n=1 Tax=Tsukamurella spumae TaxID=44753 RepID=A0A846X029_9ACTN|nr:hypothetical protein [Tsukamurella spumae]NKY18877.1 hypothetical protein [Tsukamurella spumae]